MNTVFYINIDPVIFRIGPLVISWYGVMVALAVISLVGWLLWQNRKYQIVNDDGILTAALVGISSGIIFSKLLHIIDQWAYYRENPGQILSGQGLTIWGAVLGATIGVWLYSLIFRRFRFGGFADMIAPGIIFAQAIGSVGCTFNGCCTGIQSYSPLAVIYTSPGSYAPLGIPVLPTQIFEIGYDLLVFVGLLLLRDRLKPQGALFAVYFALYAACRFGIEYLRTGTPFLFGMHQAQFIALVVLLITLPIIIIKVRLRSPFSSPSMGEGQDEGGLITHEEETPR
jgi:phosphatidylglycerol---prolipoprotein diacylglyceryl transferase